MSEKKAAKADRLDRKTKLKSAQVAATSPSAGSRENADLKLAEQAEAGARLRERHPPKASGGLDESLKATFPGSDPVALTQPGPSEGSNKPRKGGRTEKCATKRKPNE